MAKSEEEKLTERLSEIQSLMNQRAEIDYKLKLLTGIRIPSPKDIGIPKPDGFVLTDAIKSVLAELNANMTVKELRNSVGQKYSYFPDVKSVRSTAKYLIKQGVLVQDAESKSYKMKN